MLRALLGKSALFVFLLVVLLGQALAQDWIRTGTNRGAPVRLAVPDFKAATTEPQTAPLNTTFNQTLWNDLDNSGIFEMVAKSFYPLQNPGSPNEVKLDAWGNPPPNASMLAFGNLGVTNGKLAVQGWLFDAKNTASPQVLGKQYQEAATNDNARLIAHRFADEIIFRLGGGIPGIAESRIFYISSRNGHKEVWVMDYDGAGQQQLTHLNSIALSPRISPDNSRVAFSGLSNDSWQILMYSMDLGRLVSFQRFPGGNYSPAWSSDGTKLAFSSSMRSGDPEIFTVDATGANPKRLTSFKGSDVSPVWNPKTNGQIAWVSGRNGLPQIFLMDADGSNVQQITSEGYAVSPSWSPNGLLLTFAWRRHYGPGAPGGQDIYIMNIATHEFVQLTHDAGVNDFPSWSPDGRHIVFQSTRTGSEQIWTMLADGTHQQQLTRDGKNSMPNWSVK
ncbi:MAG: Tol-Pal system beta propeller repeat protein TolB [Candidatus Angelobacter sp. Gp1-AA117]|nr:MAG: Tol-Pal system beta propeller repeat protein TolB [Candidatus Angelobacter sp. Gp1-AA117]